jgi:hypothetical protein
VAVIGAVRSAEAARRQRQTSRKITIQAQAYSKCDLRAGISQQEQVPCVRSLLRVLRVPFHERGKTADEYGAALDAQYSDYLHCHQVGRNC